MSSEAAPSDAKVRLVTGLPGRGRGRGVVASRPIAAGEVALVFHGARLRRRQVRDFTHSLEIGPGVFLGPSGELDDFVNHSCSPNCAVEVDEEQVVLRALRAIRRGEELTYDYSTTMLTDPTSFECTCGSASCRGVVKRWPDLGREVREDRMRRGLVPSFVVAHRAGRNGRNGR